MYAKNFKDLMDKDLDTTIYNTREFAEIHNIEYGSFQKKIPIIFDLDEEKNRKTTAADHAEGIHVENTTIRVRLSDLKKVPRHGARLILDGELFEVVNSRQEYNEIIIELAGYDE